MDAGARRADSRCFTAAKIIQRELPAAAAGTRAPGPAASGWWEGVPCHPLAAALGPGCPRLARQPPCRCQSPAQPPGGGCPARCRLPRCPGRGLCRRTGPPQRLRLGQGTRNGRGTRAASEAGGSDPIPGAPAVLAGCARCPVLAQLLPLVRLFTLPGEILSGKHKIWGGFAFPEGTEPSVPDPDSRCCIPWGGFSTSPTRGCHRVRGTSASSPLGLSPPSPPRPAQLPVPSSAFPCLPVPQHPGWPGRPGSGQHARSSPGPSRRCRKAGGRAKRDARSSSPLPLAPLRRESQASARPRKAAVLGRSP